MPRRAISSNLDALADAWEWTGEDRLVHALPLFHVHGLVLGTLGPLRLGGHLRHLVRFDAATAAQALSDGGTMLFGVPTMYHRIAAEAEGDPTVAAGLRSARLLVSGSAPLPAPLFTRIEQATGQQVVERYGLTETLMNTAGRADGVRKPGYVGLPLPNVEVRIVLDEGGDLTDFDGETIGEVAVRGPNVFTGYLNRPDATAEAMRDGWFFTGDLATRTADGYVRIVGRRSTDLIKTGGYKVGAGEIEVALLEHPEVSEVAVTAGPDEDLGRADHRVGRRGGHLRDAGSQGPHQPRRPAARAAQAPARGPLPRRAAAQRDGQGRQAAPRNVVTEVAGRLVVERPAKGVTVLRIERPERRGALSPEILEALREAFAAADDGCLVVTGTGEIFSAGYDLSGIGDPVDPERAHAAIAPETVAALDALHACRVPVIAALNGPALGGGLELALGCDVRLAVPGAYLAAPAGKLGLVYSPGGLERILGGLPGSLPFELFVLGRRVEAERAHALGVVTEIVAPEELEADGARGRRGGARAGAAGGAGERAGAARAAGGRRRRGPRRARRDPTRRDALGRVRGGRRGVPRAPRARVALERLERRDEPGVELRREHRDRPARQVDVQVLADVDRQLPAVEMHRDGRVAAAQDVRDRGAGRAGPGGERLPHAALEDPRLDRVRPELRPPAHVRAVRGTSRGARSPGRWPGGRAPRARVGRARGSPSAGCRSRCAGSARCARRLRARPPRAGAHGPCRPCSASRSGCAGAARRRPSGSRTRARRSSRGGAGT